MKEKIILALLGMCCLTACHKTPTTTVINNHNDISNDKISEQTTLEPEENMIHIEISEEEIKETITCGNVTVNIEGMLYYPDRVDGLYEYLASETDYSEYEKNMMFLFGEYEDEAIKDERSKMIFANKDDKYSAWLINSRVYDVNTMISRRGDISFQGFNIPVTEEERKVDMSFGDAITKADEVINRIGVKEQVLFRCKYYEEILTKNPYGEDTAPFGDTIVVSYVQQLQGIPVRSFHNDKYLNPITVVSFNSKGIKNVIIHEYKYERNRRIEQCLIYEQVMKIFEEYIAENKDYNSSKFIEISFEYVICKADIKGNEVFVGRPCWVFRVEDTSYGPEDIYIDAETGKIMERQKWG